MITPHDYTDSPQDEKVNPGLGWMFIIRHILLLLYTPFPRTILNTDSEDRTSLNLLTSRNSRRALMLISYPNTLGPVPLGRYGVYSGEVGVKPTSPNFPSSPLFPHTPIVGSATPDPKIGSNRN